MKKITLHGATTRNDGTYADAGVDLVVGDKPDQITADRAKEHVDASKGVEAADGSKSATRE
jgi:hypothetical protein